MAQVTIGVPVYNGAGLIAECLDCLCNQTFRDIEIIVSDNASTDATGQIVREYAARDPRIRYIRQPENIGLMRNFKAVLDAAQSPYFLFRCHDDLSSLNYVEALHSAFVAKPEATLAAPTVETRRTGREPRFHRPVFPGRTSELLKIRDLLFGSHQAWFCGLWSAEFLRPVLARVWSRYDSPWGPDHLTIYPALVSQAVAFAPEAVYIQKITPKEGDGAYSKPKLGYMMKLRGIFMAVCHDFRRDQNISGAKEMALAVMTWVYTGKRIFKVRNIIRYSLLGRW